MSLLLLACLFPLFSPAPLPQKADPVSFTRDIYPLLSRNCLQCHGPSQQQGNFRVDSRNALLNHTIIVPHKPDNSQLLQRIALPQSDEQHMPPVGNPLTQTQQQLLRQWILQGAEIPDPFTPPAHWAWSPPVKPTLPQPQPHTQNSPSDSPIDAFVQQHLEDHQLKLAPQAEPDVLIRRLYLALIGLPPSPTEVRAFTADPTPAHYRRIVDQLLQRPQFGERWARHWLDLARYADSHGFQRDDLRDSWAYRDWVIQAMNNDLPYDQFTIAQLAGDLLPNTTESQRIATGFHRCSPTNVEAGSLPEETRAEQLIDRVNTTATIWLGTTLECAQCHDHKYDPFTMQDYYQLLACFNNTAIEADRANPAQPSSIRFIGPEMPLSDPRHDSARNSLQQQITQLQQQLDERRQQLTLELPRWAQELRQKHTLQPQTDVILKAHSIQSLGTMDAWSTLPDGSLLVTGADPPDNDLVTVTIQQTLQNVRALQLETLTHDSLPGQGPGRGDAERPNFVLHELTATVNRHAAAPEPLIFTSATADFSQQKWPVAAAIDGKPDTGWAIAPQFARPHHAVFLLSKPLTLNAQDSLTIQLDQHFGNGRSIGRLRLTALSAESAATQNSSSTPDPQHEQLLAIAAVPAADWQPAQQQQLLDYRTRLDQQSQQLQQQLLKLQKQLQTLAPPTTLVMVEQQTRPSFIFQRGDYRQPGDPVQPGIPALFRTAQQTPQPRNRLELAQWLVSPQNPLAARAAVNRWWAELFGTGLVTTPEDLGSRCDPPSHPELLDWLAVELQENGWSMKHLLRSIVLSRTWQQSAHGSPELLQIDDQNRLLARGPTFRMDAEMIRDHLLAVSGLLDHRQFGPPIRPPQPAGFWSKIGGQQYDYQVSDGSEKYRRSIYIVIKRSAIHPSLATFDGPARFACTVQRSRTSTALQALALLNEPVAATAAAALAAKLLNSTTDSTDQQRITTGFQLCTARTPQPQELQVLLQLLQQQRNSLLHRPTDVALINNSSPENSTPPTDPLEQAAWTTLATVLLNLHETSTRP